MDAIVGQQAPFDRGRQQMKDLAGLEVTAKSVERSAEEIGADIAARQQREIRKAVQLDLPIIVGKTIPILYIEMDGTGVPVVKKETEGRIGKTEGQPAHTREVKLGCVFTQTAWNEQGYAIRDPEHRRNSLSRRDPHRRSLPRPPAPLGSDSPLIPKRSLIAESVDKGPSEPHAR